VTINVADFSASLTEPMSVSIACPRAMVKSTSIKETISTTKRNKRGSLRSLTLR